MANSEKKKAVNVSRDDNTGTDASSSASDAKEADAVGSSEPTRPPENEDIYEAEVLEPDDAIDPELAAESDAAVEDAMTESEIVAEAKAEVAEWQDKYLRLHAEWDTYRRRTNEQRAEEKARAAEKLVTGLLPVIDDFERTIGYAEDNGEEGLLSGVEAVHTKLIDTLKKDGVEIIDPVGEAFDALEDQAVGTVEDTSVPDETVAEVYQKGYRLGAKVLRPAMVTVTSGGVKREKSADADEEN